MWVQASGPQAGAPRPSLYVREPLISLLQGSPRCSCKSSNRQRPWGARGLSAVLLVSADPKSQLCSQPARSQAPHAGSPVITGTTFRCPTRKGRNSVARGGPGTGREDTAQGLRGQCPRLCPSPERGSLQNQLGGVTAGLTASCPPPSHMGKLWDPVLRAGLPGGHVCATSNPLFLLKN